MKTSRFALAAAAGLFVLGAYAQTPAKAADLGGNCCADLEERVAELEATTARKGNRVVSLQVYGQVNKALLVWDDGIDSDSYVVDNSYSSTRLGLKGKGQLKPGWSAGYNIEWELLDANSSGVYNGWDEGSDTNKGKGLFNLRQANAYIDSKQLGRITIGQQSMASDGIAEINLGGSGVDAKIEWVKSFEVRDSGGGFGPTWGSLASNLDGNSRDDAIRYDTPSIYGFILSASWGDNDKWDVALRFAKEWNSLRIAAGVAYYEDQTGAYDKTGVSGSVSVMHVPTGIYGMFASGTQDDDALAPALEDDTYYYGQLGISKNWFGYGKTTVYGDYGNYQNFGANKRAEGEVDRYGAGVVQKFDSAATEIYAHYQHLEVDNDYVVENGSLEDLDVGVVGMRIKF